MAHFIVDYSANLDELFDVDALLNAIVQTASATGVFPLAGIRARAIRCEHYAIADGHPDNSFVNLSVRVGPGRDEKTRTAAAEALMATLRAQLDSIYSAQPIAISLEMRELDTIRYNDNNLRERIARRQPPD